METRSLAIGLVAVVAAFAAAFGLAKSGGSKTETAGAGVKAQSIKVAAPAAVAGVEVGGTLPALKAAHKAKKAKKKAADSTTSSRSDEQLVVDGDDTAGHARADHDPEHRAGQQQHGEHPAAEHTEAERAETPDLQQRRRRLARHPS